MLVDRRQALSFVAIAPILGVRIANAQDSPDTSTLVADALGRLEAPNSLRRQRALFSFYTELLRELRPDDAKPALKTTSLLNEFIQKTGAETNLSTEQDIKEEVVGIYNEARGSMEEFLVTAGIVQDSPAMTALETSYLAMLLFFGAESLRQGRSSELIKSAWCCWPICF